MSETYGVRKYPNKYIWYVYDYANRCVVSTPWYSKLAAQHRADYMNSAEYFDGEENS